MSFCLSSASDLTFSLPKALFFFSSLFFLILTFALKGPDDPYPPVSHTEKASLSFFCVCFINRFISKIIFQLGSGRKEFFFCFPFCSQHVSTLNPDSTSLFILATGNFLFQCLFFYFLVADQRLYKRLCPSVGWSVRSDRVGKWENTHFRPCPPVRDWYWPCIRQYASVHL